MGMLRVMSRRGDDRITWDEQKVLAGDPETAAAIREAERIFAQERAKGATAFRINPGKPAERIEQIVQALAVFSNCNAIMKGRQNLCQMVPVLMWEPQRVVQQAYALTGSCCGARARSATRAVDRAGVAQDTQQFRLRPFALVRRAPW